MKKNGSDIKKSDTVFKRYFLVQAKITSSYIKGVLKLLSLFFGLQIAFISTTIAQSQKFTLSTGGTVDTNNMTWSIAGDSEGQSPNILSELNFIGISSLGLYLSGSYAPFNSLQIEGFYQRSHVFMGKGKDADYADDNRENPTFNLPFSSNKGNIKIFRLGAKSMFFQKQKVSFGGGIGYRSTLQIFHILSSEHADLRSTYRARWKGPEISVNGEYEFSNVFSITTEFYYIFFRYDAEANWNLIEVFEHPLSFTHDANGQGMEFEISLRYKLFKDLVSLSLSSRLGRLHANRGIDVAYMKVGTQVSTQFNGSVYDYSGIRLGIIFTF